MPTPPSRFARSIKSTTQRAVSVQRSSSTNSNSTSKDKRVICSSSSSISTMTDVELTDLSKKMMSSLDIKDRTYHLKTYKDCFLGTEAVKWMIDNDVVKTSDDAVAIGQQMMNDRLVYHVTRDEPFRNEKKFYRFTEADDHGKVDAENHQPWSEVVKLLPSWKDIDGGKQEYNTGYVSSAIKRDSMGTDSTYSSSGPPILDELDISPLDKHNTSLLDSVHPSSWKNPTPKGKYTMVVIGAGTGGLVSAAGAAGVGAHVALIESHLTGGDCLNFGCVPSKALIRASRAVHDVRHAGQYGVEVDPSAIHVNFGKAMERLRRLRAKIAKHDSYDRFTRELGIDVYRGHASFTSSNALVVDGQELSFHKAVIATGASAAVPNGTFGLKDVPYLTNYTVFNLEDLPPRLCVIGAGPIGLELAQAFARFGSEVTCHVRGDKILPKEDRDAADIVYKQLVADGVKIHFRSSIAEISCDDDSVNKYVKPFPKFQAKIKRKGDVKLEEQEFDAVLIATGRRPNVTNMGLEEAGVKYNERSGVDISDQMQTSNKSIYAVGDVCTKFQFTHMADFMARTVIRNALFLGRGTQSSLLVPWATFTEPEVAHVGLYEADLNEQKIPFDTYTKYFKDVDRAICDDGDEAPGFCKIHTKKGTDEIVGATIVNPNAGNMISEISVAMQNNIGLGTLAYTIHPYPTQAEAIRMCGDLYNKTRLTPAVKGLLGRVANSKLT